MKVYKKIEVQAHAGYRADESPRAFYLAGKKTEVVRIMEQWLEEIAGSGERYRCFKVRGNDWRVHVLCFDEVKMEWNYRSAV